MYIKMFVAVVLVFLVVVLCEHIHKNRLRHAAATWLMEKNCSYVEDDATARARNDRINEQFLADHTHWLDQFQSEQITCLHRLYEMGKLAAVINQYSEVGSRPLLYYGVSNGDFGLSFDIWIIFHYRHATYVIDESRTVLSQAHWLRQNLTRDLYHQAMVSFR